MHKYVSKVSHYTIPIPTQLDYYLLCTYQSNGNFTQTNTTVQCDT